MQSIDLKLLENSSSREVIGLLKMMSSTQRLQIFLKSPLLKLKYGALFESTIPVTLDAVYPSRTYSSFSDYLFDYPIGYVNQELQDFMTLQNLPRRQDKIILTYDIVTLWWLRYFHQQNMLQPILRLPANVMTLFNRKSADISLDDFMGLLLLKFHSEDFELSSDEKQQIFQYGSALRVSYEQDLTLTN